MENKQYLYQGFTLVDITPTGQTSHKPDRVFERSQQRNYETVIQILSLRTQVKMLDCWNLKKDVDSYHFGINYTGEHQVWSFLFSVEYQGIYQDAADSYGTLRKDFQLIPVITGLHETAEFEKSIFYTSGPWNNIYFKYSNR
jgi:hypothetical protein